MRVEARVTVTLAVVVWILLAAGPVSGHIVNPDGSTSNLYGITHDQPQEDNIGQCVYWNGNCSVHSFTFASANDLGDRGFFCAEIWTTAYPPRSGNTVKTGCGLDVDIARVCTTYAHSGGSGPLHCVDQDSAMRKAGAWWSGPYGINITTIRRHVVY